MSRIVVRRLPRWPALRVGDVVYDGGHASQARDVSDVVVPHDGR